MPQYKLKNATIKGDSTGSGGVCHGHFLQCWQRIGGFHILGWPAGPRINHAFERKRQQYSSDTTTTDYHQSLPGRLAEAVFIATELKRTNSYLQLICPRDQALGGRPSDHTPALIGTTCEAWANREWRSCDTLSIEI